MTERLEWAFNLYDINRDGLISREEMLNIISAIYELMGRFCEPSVYENTTRDHVEMVFQVILNVIYYYMHFKDKKAIGKFDYYFKQFRGIIHFIFIMLKAPYSLPL